MAESNIENSDLNLPLRETSSNATGMKIIPLSEGSFTIDKTKLFVPFNEEKDVLNERPVGSLLVEIQPFLVITSQSRTRII